MNDIIQINEKNYTVYSFRGKVLENRLGTLSHTSNEYGREITTLTRIPNTKVYLQAENGEQEMFSVPEFHLDAIEGHDVIVISLIDDNQKNELVAFINITLGKVQCLKCSLDADIEDPTMNAYGTLTAIVSGAVWVFTSWKWALSTCLIAIVLGAITLGPRHLAEIRQRVQSREKTKEDIINILQQRHHISQQHYHLAAEAVRLTNDRTPTKDS